MSALEEFLYPQPAEVFIFDDFETRFGQCKAQSVCWWKAAESEYEWCVHFEEDLTPVRPIDVSALAFVMDANPFLFQMTLMRQAWAAEIPWAGYVAKDPGWYERDSTLGLTTTDGNWPIYEWMWTQRNWANAPTLFRTALAREFPWPEEPGCETTIGPQMLERYPEGKFGLWGWGESQVCHVGVERAPHSHGY